MNRLEVEDTALGGLKRVRRSRLGDQRGFLARLFCADELRDAGWNAPVAQINHTRTADRGSVRGLHFQRPPRAEKKLVHRTCGRETAPAALRARIVTQLTVIRRTY